MAEVVIIGIGNRARGDDGVGCRVIELMSSKVDELMSSKVKLIDAEMMPENYIEPTVREKPIRILLVDACPFGGQPGEIRLFPSSDFHRLMIGGFSTHTLPLGLLAELLAIETNAQVWLLAIEPANTNLGEGISPVVDVALPAVVDFIRSWVVNSD